MQSFIFQGLCTSFFLILILQINSDLRKSLKIDISSYFESENYQYTYSTFIKIYIVWVTILVQKLHTFPVIFKP